MRLIGVQMKCFVSDVFEQKRWFREAYRPPLTCACVAFSRACDYVRLIGVLARENASLIAAHLREQHEDAKDRKYDIINGQA